jgi:hypothetical protein
VFCFSFFGGCKAPGYTLYFAAGCRLPQAQHSRHPSARVRSYPCRTGAILRTTNQPTTTTNTKLTNRAKGFCLLYAAIPRRLPTLSVRYRSAQRTAFATCAALWSVLSAPPAYVVVPLPTEPYSGTTFF